MVESGLRADERRDGVLEDSIREHGHLVVTHRGPRGWRAFKSKFVSGSRTSDSITVRLHEEPDSAGASSLKPGDTLGVTFRSGHSKCLFSSVLGDLDRQSEGVLVTLRWPREVQRLQRRVFQRAAPPPSSVVAVRFWKESPHGTPGAEPTVRYGQLEDLSAGGMRIKATDPTDLELEVSYRCAFSPRTGAPALVLEATLRHHEATDNNRASLGFQFLGLETTPEGRRTLARIARIVSSYHQSRPGNRR